MVPRETLWERIHEADVLIPAMCRIDAGLIGLARRLRLIQQWGSGLDGVDIPAATAAGIAVANVPTAGTGNAESVAEWCVMAALCLSRRYPVIEYQIKEGAGWGSPSGRALMGKTAGFVGFGGIGRALAQRLRPFGMRMVAVRRTEDPELARQTGLDWIRSYAALPALLAASDYLFICVPLTVDTQGMIGLAELNTLPEGAFLINAARGPVVVQEALMAVLSSGRLAGAALDVFWREPLPADDPITFLPNVLLTPHIAGVTDASYNGIGNGVAENIRRAMKGEPALHQANDVIPGHRESP